MNASKVEFAEQLDKGCPLVLGGPLPHVMAAKAVAFLEASRPEFADYAHAIVKNAQALSAALVYDFEARDFDELRRGHLL